MKLLGVDTGGTFTDFVLFADGAITVHKVLSTPAAPEQAILQGIAELGLDTHGDDCLIVHGSTVATNAVLEGKGVETLYIANEGLTDILAIGRQARRELYRLQPHPNSPPVSRDRCIPVSARISATGAVLTPLTNSDIDRVLDAIARFRPRAVAINLLYSFLDADHERRLRAALPDDLFVSCSSEVLPEYREYERGIATWLNAWIGPLMQSYLQRLDKGLGTARLSVMQSSGLTVRGEAAAARSVNLLLSGPAGGLAGARFMSGLSGRQRLLSFDMGGTSTDVALMDGELCLTSEGRIGDYPVAVPMVDMHTIGAGGGSVATVDEGGLLQVGPESAGADPGPACYGRGGVRATVTDANLVLGRLPATALLGGNLHLDVTAARKAVEALAASMGVGVEEAALGIIAVANEHMTRALRVMSVQRGLDPRGLTLVSFGGAGGLHVCALAEAMEMPEAVVPHHAGVLSALGMLVAPPGRELSRTFAGILADLQDSVIDAEFDRLYQQGVEELQREGLAPQELTVRRSVDLRYRGQSWTLNVPWRGAAATTNDFHDRHERRYGHRLALGVELVNLRLSLGGRAREIPMSALSADEDMVETTSVYGHAQPVPVLTRQQLGAGERPGPLLVTDPVATTWVDKGWLCRCDESGNILLRRETTPPGRETRKIPPRP